MLGLFGSLNLGSRALLTQQQGVEVAGHNIANVNNPAYSRQRLAVQTSPSIISPLGPVGTGVEGTGITRLRNAILDRQFTSEMSVRGYLESYQQALQFAQAGLGQEIDRRATGAEGTAAAAGVGAQHSMADGLSDLFNAFQSLSTQPSSLSERQVLLMQASDLALQFNQTAGRLASVRSSINDSIVSQTDSANQLLKTIAELNDQIQTTEAATGSEANDLRDLRQQRIEDLSKLVKVDIGTNGADLTVSAGGELLASGRDQIDSLEAYDAGGGQFLVRTQTGGVTLNLTGGSVAGFIDVRDNELVSLGNDLDQLAGELITQVNTIHSAGFGLNGSTGAAFFTGTNAATIGVNAALTSDPSLIQASGVAGNQGDNQVALALAGLGNQKFAALNNQTFSEHYGHTIAQFGQSLSNANSALVDQGVVEGMLMRQRDSVSGVSIDEEMTDLVRYQKAYEASARFISVIDELLDTVMNIKR